MTFHQKEEKVRHLLWKWCFLGFFLMAGVMPVQASPQSDFKDGLAAFQELEFAKCIRLLQTALLSNKLSKQQKLRSYATLAVAFYNTNRLDNARDFWSRAVRLKRNVRLPSGQAPSVQRYFEGIRKRLTAKKSKVVVVPTRPPPRGRERLVPQRKPVQRRKTLKRRKMALKAPSLRKPAPATPKAGRHPISPYVGALGVLTLGAAGGFSFIAREDTFRMTNNATDSFAAFESAQTNTMIANALWISGAVLVSGAVVLLVFDLRSSSSARASRPLTPSNTLRTVRLSLP